MMIQQQPSKPSSPPSPPRGPRRRPTMGVRPPRRSLEGMAALLLVVASMPVGVAVNVALYRSGTVERGEADSVGFTITIAMTTLGMILGWHARRRILRQPEDLQGVTTSTIALFGGASLLIACLVVLLRTIFS